ncbi:MAG: DUF4347 domain-containing protein, partial [Alphaproteobacteria bacterium]|nr:DUF4347 domain-containing protein [Alphaproteobacteria bacterium]
MRADRRRFEHRRGGPLADHRRCGDRTLRRRLSARHHPALHPRLFRAGSASSHPARHARHLSPRATAPRSGSGQGFDAGPQWSQAMNATFDPAARHPARVGILALESRIMFDGAAVAEMVDTIADGKEADSPASTHVPTRNGADPSPSAAAPVVERDGPAAERPAIVAPAERHEVVVVDTSVEDWQSLVAGMNPNTPMILLEPDKDGMSELEQMAAALSQFDDLDAIHLVAEGRTGAVILGREALTSDDLAAVGPQLAQIGATLKPGGDFMLYSCSVAGGPVGAAFIDDLSRAMGDVDIAASTDLTGPTLLGGDWDLEYRVGEIDTVLPFTLQGMQDISHCLGCTVSGTKVYYNNVYVAHYVFQGGYQPKIFTQNDYFLNGGQQNGRTDGVDIFKADWSSDTDSNRAAYMNSGSWPVLCGTGNTAPTFTGGANTGLNVSENAAITTITTAMLAVKDDEQAIDARTYTVTTAPTKGTLTKSGATVSANGTFTQADIDANNIKYTPTANNIGADSFAFSVADGAGGSLAGQTFSITINDVNPAISNASVSWDENNSTGTVATVTASSDTNGLTYAITGGNTGTAFAIDNNGAITVNSVAALDYETNPTFSLTVTVDDEDADATADSTATITVNLNNLNDAPVNTVPGAQTTNEDTNLVFSGGNALSVAETDAGQTLTTVVSVGAGTGTLTVTTGGGATINTNGTNSVEIIGTAAQVNSALGTVTYAPTGDASGTGYATLQIQTTDNGTGTLSDTDTVSINVTAIADTPAVTNASTTPAT